MLPQVNLLTNFSHLLQFSNAVREVAIFSDHAGLCLTYNWVVLKEADALVSDLEVMTQVWEAIKGLGSTKQQ